MLSFKCSAAITMFIMTCSAIAAMELNPQSEQFILPALAPHQESEVKDSDGQVDNVEDYKDSARRILREILVSPHARARLERMIREIFTEVPNLAVRRNRRQKSKGCEVNLGGHCTTEEMDKIADSYYYLLSSNSPGKKRRSVDSVI